MAVVASQIKVRLPAIVASSFLTADVGGAKTATNITGSADEAIFSMPSNALGDGEAVQYAKVFLCNTNSTDDAADCGIWIANALDDLTTASQLTFVSSSSSDSAAVFIRCIGFNASGVPITEDRALAGLTPVTTSLLFQGPLRLEFRLATGGARTNAIGDIQVTHDGNVVGFIPAGFESASSEFDLGLESGLDDSESISDAGTAPAGVTFSRPRTSTDRLLVNDDSGDLPAGSGQGVWIRWTVAERMGASDRVRVALKAAGA